MADVAFIFHWQPDWLLAQPTRQLMAWRDRALARWNRVHAPREREDR